MYKEYIKQKFPNKRQKQVMADMSSQINLRDIFFRQLRSKLIQFLIKGPLHDWDPELIITIADNTISGMRADIDRYIYNNRITLLNMSDHVNKIIQEILVPKLNEEQVR